MSISILSSTIDTTSTPQLILTNPLPDGLLHLYVNLNNGVNAIYINALLSQGVLTPFVQGVAVSIEGNIITGQLPDNSNMYITYNYESSSSNGFYISSDESLSAVTVNGWIVPQTFSGNMSCNNVYNASGLVMNNLSWVGSALTDDTGTFTVDISSAGFSTVTSVQVSPVNASSDLASAIKIAAVTDITTTSISGKVASLLGSFVGAGTSVYITISGF